MFIKQISVFLENTPGTLRELKMCIRDRPYVVEGVLKQIAEALKGKAMLSVVAGYTFERYQPLVDASVRVQYVMPNTPCMRCV